MITLLTQIFTEIATTLKNGRDYGHYLAESSRNQYKHDKSVLNKKSVNIKKCIDHLDHSHVNVGHCSRTISKS